MWDIPGGFCEPGEHPAVTATREIMEETGIPIQIVGFLGIWLDEYRREKEFKRTLNIYYHATPLKSTIPTIDANEVLEAKFFPPSRLPNALAFPGHVPAALKAWKMARNSNQRVTGLLDRRSF
jgi:8-oxo-dGTP pyrophosphatase MutT (NUDIX family)